eukprot:1374982-Amorphochlora_amoeboformis.AAC.1
MSKKNTFTLSSGRYNTRYYMCRPYAAIHLTGRDRGGTKLHVDTQADNVVASGRWKGGEGLQDMVADADSSGRLPRVVAGYESYDGERTCPVTGNREGQGRDRLCGCGNVS